jgi:hypothetical protein
MQEFKKHVFPKLAIPHFIMDVVFEDIAPRMHINSRMRLIVFTVRIYATPQTNSATATAAVKIRRFGHAQAKTDFGYYGGLPRKCAAGDAYVRNGNVG